MNVVTRQRTANGALIIVKGPRDGNNNNNDDDDDDDDDNDQAVAFTLLRHIGFLVKIRIISVLLARRRERGNLRRALLIYLFIKNFPRLPLFSFSFYIDARARARTRMSILLFSFLSGRKIQSEINVSGARYVISKHPRAHRSRCIIRVVPF